MANGEWLMGKWQTANEGGGGWAVKAEGRVGGEATVKVEGRVRRGGGGEGG